MSSSNILSDASFCIEKQQFCRRPLLNVVRTTTNTTCNKLILQEAHTGEYMMPLDEVAANGHKAIAKMRMEEQANCKDQDQNAEGNGSRL